MQRRRARAGIAPGGLGRNRDFLERDGYVRLADSVDPARRMLLYDPQTSGGLLLLVPGGEVAALLRELPDARRIGRAQQPGSRPLSIV